MKAKLKKTGEIINIAEYDVVKLDKCDSYGCSIEIPYEEVEQFYDDKGVPLGMPIVFPSVIEADFDINWEQRRYEIAKESITAIMSNDDFLGLVIEVESSKNNREIPKAVSVAAVAFADALIEELKKEKQHGN